MKSEFQDMHAGNFHWILCHMQSTSTTTHTHLNQFCFLISLKKKIYFKMFIMCVGRDWGWGGRVHPSVVPEEGRIYYQTLLWASVTDSCGQLVWVVGIGPKTPRRAASVLNVFTAEPSLQPTLKLFLPLSIFSFFQYSSGEISGPVQSSPKGWTLRHFCL